MIYCKHCGEPLDKQALNDYYEAMEANAGIHPEKICSDCWLLYENNDPYEDMDTFDSDSGL